MRKFLTKIICFAAAVAVALGIFLISACGPDYSGKPLAGNTDGEVVSNGGFAVEKGDYIYFINGREAYTADNTFGKVVKGAIMRISKTDLKSRNYSNVDTVVPLVAYSGNAKTGLFIYGDYVYYTTPSTDKNSDGEIQNSHLTFRRTRLNGTDTSKNYFMQLADNAVDYRYVEVDGTVYIMYVATSEKLYENSYTNLHSYNTETGVDTLLAYNIDKYVFDNSDVTNPRVFYTMNVTDFEIGTSYSSDYNQVYTVTADETERNEYDFSDVEDFDADKDPLYINCGDLVLDGYGFIGDKNVSVTQFNGEGAKDVTRASYTYTLSSYENGYLYFTRYAHIISGNDSANALYSIADKDLISASWNSVTSQDGEAYNKYITDKETGSTKVYLYDASGKLEGALILASDGIQKANLVDGKIPDEVDNDTRFYITTDGQATLLFVEGNYIYYSLSGGDGYTVNRVDYSGEYKDYNGLAVTLNGNSEYQPVAILDVQSLNGWYLPEMFGNQILFISQTKYMTSYEYAMVCDLNTADGKMMTNAEIKALNEKYDGLIGDDGDIADVDESVYENLQNALKYAFYANESEYDYIYKLSEAYKDIKNYDYNHYWSEESFAKYDDFLKAKGDWEGYAETRTVNGKEVAANKRDYYYALLGKMTDGDIESYNDDLKGIFNISYPEEELSWFEGLSTGEKAGFIIGVVLGGLIVIAAAVLVPLLIIKRKKKKMPQYKKGIKVDTTDDRNIDVYADEDGESGNDNNE
ncbi:MAG: hypothetical protein K2N22_01310 [Clostridia bacterium]|nr:hypothetical protein [Clostridia bacterium]